ncbi:MAG: alanine racemase [Alphaproteobacteria bacterium]
MWRPVTTRATSPFERAGAELIVDLGAVAANWRTVARGLGPGVACAAVIKADAYGLGMAPVARALTGAGCGAFFVATPDEGASLRRVVPDATINVLHGVPPGAEGFFTRHRLIPVINDLGELERWRRHLARRGGSAIVHLDTGLNRLGMTAEDSARLAAEPAALAGLRITWMGHLACADEPGHPMNAEQLTRFRALLARLPKAPASFAASAGILLGPGYHFDLVRPGYCLYGGNPVTGMAPMRPVVRVRARILQVREIDTPQSVGYGAAHRVAGPSRIATVPVGYADGYLRSLGGRGTAVLDGIRVPLVGRISMDLSTIDVTAVPANRARPGATVDLIGSDVTIDDVAKAAGTIGYEILTALGRRYPRRHVDGVAP